MDPGQAKERQQAIHGVVELLIEKPLLVWRLGPGRNDDRCQDAPDVHFATRRRRSFAPLVAEYALRDLGKPIGVSSYGLRLVEALPEGLEGRLPTVEEIEEGLGGEGRYGTKR